MSKKLNQMIREEVANVLQAAPGAGEAIQQLTNPSRKAAARVVNKAGDVYDRYGVGGTLQRAGEEGWDQLKRTGAQAGQDLRQFFMPSQESAAPAAPTPIPPAQWWAREQAHRIARPRATPWPTGGWGEPNAPMVDHNLEEMIREELTGLLSEMVDTDPDADSDADFSAPAEAPPADPGIRVKVPQRRLDTGEPSIRDAIKYIMQRGALPTRPLVPGPPGVVENITWTDVQNALRTGIEKTGATPLIRKGAEAVMTAAEHDPTGIIDKSFRGGQMIGKYGPGELADEAPSATLRATGHGLQAAGQEAGKVEDYWKQGIGPGLQQGGEEMVAAADGLNESQDPFKRMSELALKSYGTCKYED